MTKDVMKKSRDVISRSEMSASFVTQDSLELAISSAAKTVLHDFNLLYSLNT